MTLWYDMRVESRGNVGAILTFFSNVDGTERGKFPPFSVQSASDAWKIRTYGEHVTVKFEVDSVSDVTVIAKIRANVSGRKGQAEASMTLGIKDIVKE